MATAATSKKRLALAIIDFLNSSLADGTVASEDGESIEIASNCIAEAFKVDPTDTAAVADALGGQNLQSIYGVYEKLKGKSSASSSTAEAKPAAAATPAAAAGTVDTKENAEKLKQQGNAAMQSRDYDTAINFYTQALELIPLNPIYLSNRAAAYSGKQKHDLAKNDAEMAVAADPKFAKAWSRLGLAKFALGDTKGSMEAYQKGIEAEGSGGSDAMKKGYETAKKRYAEEGGTLDGDVAEGTRGMPGGAPGGMPDLSSLASMLGGGGGPGGGGPDLSQLLNNPMMRQMAQNVMSNPDMMNNIMNNPRLREMADSFAGGQGAGGRGGGMPDLSSLMQDPSIAEMARNFMGGAGGAGGPGGAGGAGRGGSR